MMIIIVVIHSRAEVGDWVAEWRSETYHHYYYSDYYHYNYYHYYMHVYDLYTIVIIIIVTITIKTSGAEEREARPLRERETPFLKLVTVVSVFQTMSETMSENKSS